MGCCSSQDPVFFTPHKDVSPKLTVRKRKRSENGREFFAWTEKVYIDKQAPLEDFFGENADSLNNIFGRIYETMNYMVYATPAELNLFESRPDLWNLESFRNDAWSTNQVRYQKETETYNAFMRPSPKVQQAVEKPLHQRVRAFFDGNEEITVAETEKEIWNIVDPMYFHPNKLVEAQEEDLVQDQITKVGTSLLCAKEPHQFYDKYNVQRPESRASDHTIISNQSLSGLGDTFGYNESGTSYSAFQWDMSDRSLLHRVLCVSACQMMGYVNGLVVPPDLDTIRQCMESEVACFRRRPALVTIHLSDPLVAKCSLLDMVFVVRQRKWIEEWLQHMDNDDVPVFNMTQIFPMDKIEYIIFMHQMITVLFEDSLKPTDIRYVDDKVSRKLTLSDGRGKRCRGFENKQNMYQFYRYLHDSIRQSNSEAYASVYRVLRSLSPSNHGILDMNDLARVVLLYRAKYPPFSLSGLFMYEDSDDPGRSFCE